MSAIKSLIKSIEAHPTFTPSVVAWVILMLLPEWVKDTPVKLVSSFGGLFLLSLVAIVPVTLAVLKAIESQGEKP